jgi:predicted  nucleic acid-binding Zn-ribbon protein
MPHQCVRCGKLYEDGSKELLSGCECGGRFFFFIRKKNLEEAKKITVHLTKSEKEQIEKDVLDIVGSTEDDQPVVLDLENIRVLKPGKYELDIVELFKNKPLVYKMGEGTYVIDLVSSFEKTKKKD